MTFKLPSLSDLSNLLNPSSKRGDLVPPDDLAPSSTYKHERVALIADEPGLQVALLAQYNPAQLQLDETSTWNKSASSGSDHPDLEFSTTAPRSLSLELFFDTFEASGDRNVKRRYVDPLTRLLRVIDADSFDEAKRRPPLVQLRWGGALEAFTGVMESISTKLTMFLPDGTPVRATCSIKMLEASRSSFDRRAPNRVTVAPSARR